MCKVNAKNVRNIECYISTCLCMYLEYDDNIVQRSGRRENEAHI